MKRNSKRIGIPDPVIDTLIETQLKEGKVISKTPMPVQSKKPKTKKPNETSFYTSVNEKGKIERLERNF